MVTKRQLGLLLILGALLALIGLPVLDALGFGQFAGSGPAQRIAMGAAVVVGVIGLTLLPLGNRPA